MTIDTLPDSFEQMVESKYLKKEDVAQPKLFTVAAFTKADVARKGEPQKIKWIMHFEEQGVKPMVMGATTLQLLKMATGAAKPSDCIGHQVVLFNDPTIMMGHQIVGGIRLRAPKNKPAPVAVDKLDDDIPF